MAVPRGLTHLAFAAPLDESTEDEVLDPMVGFPVLQNVRQDRRGGLSKRLGYAAVSSARVDGTTRSEGRRCFSHNGAACVIDSNTLDIYSETLAKSVNVGRVPPCSVSVTHLAASVATDSATRYDAVVCNGFLVLVYTTATTSEASGADVMVSTVDGNLPLRKDASFISSTSSPIFQVGAFGTTAILITGDQTTATLTAWKLDCASATTVAAGWTSVATIATDRKTSTTNLSLQSLSDRVAIAYINDSGGTSQITVKTVNASGVVETRTVNTSSATPDNLAIEGSIADTLWVAWNETLDIKVVGLDADSLASTLATTATVITGTGIRTTLPPTIVSSTVHGAATLVVSPSPTGRAYTATWTTSGGAVVPGSAFDMHGATVAARAWRQDGRLYGLFSAGNQADNETPDTLILADWTSYPWPPIALAAPNLAVSDPSSHALTLADGRPAYVIAIETAASVKSYALVAYDFTDRFRWRDTAHNGVTFLSGGLLSYVSSDRVQECSFLHAPQRLDVTADTGGTGPNGTVRYVAQFESVDGAGNLSLSGVSDPFEYTGTGLQVFPSCDPLLMTMRGTVRVSLYRTIASGKVYYKVDTRNALSTDVITFVDDKSDASLISQPQLGGTGMLPGTGGAPLQREASPYCADVVSFAGMVVVASGSDLWWSGQTIGGEGTWFSAEQFFLTVEGDGDITALAVQDGTLYAFKERAIWSVAGELPADNGSSGGLGTPRRLAGDVGCIEPSSVVVTSLGILFRSHRGIELLGRGGGAVWIGEKVQRTLASYPYVTSASLDMHNNLVRFSLANSVLSGVVGDDGGGGGRDIVFDPVINDWQSVDDKHGTVDHQPSQDACMVGVGSDQRYAWLGADGTFYVENDTYLDGSTWITMAAETGWFKVAGIQGRQFFNRLLMLARKRTDADLSVSLGYNYGTEYAAQSTWTSESINDLLTAGWPITQLRHDPNDNSEGQSIRVRIEDATPTGAGASIGTGRGATWLALTLDITTQDGTFDVPEEAA